MGGEGSLQSMITSLRNNKMLLRRKSMFKKDHFFLNMRREYYKAAKGEQNFKKATKEELKLIRERVIYQQTKENIRSWIVILILFIVVVTVSLYIKQNFQNKKTTDIKEKYFKANINQFQYYIDEGDKWISKGNWNNAIYRYEQAIKLFPDDFEANYRLALAYSYNCKFEHKNCEEGLKLTNKLIHYFPNKKSLTKLKENFKK